MAGNAVPLVSVSELVRFALPAGAQVVAGAGGLERSATWARLLRVRPPALGSVEAGEVWLLSPSALQQAGGPRALAPLVRGLADAGVVALVVAESLPQEVLVAADAASLPVVLLPADQSLPDAESRVVAFVMDRDRALADHVQQIYDRLLQALVDDGGAERLASLVSEVTGKAVFLLDEHFQPTLRVGGDEGSAAALRVLQRRFWESGDERLVVARLQLLPVPPGSTTTAAALTQALTLRGATAGYVVLLGPPDDFGDFEYRVADRATRVLAIELAKQSAVMEARLRLQGDLLQDLLDNPGPASDAVLARARGLGYDLRRPHVVLVLQPRVTEDEGTGRSQHQRFAEVARRRLAVAVPGVLVREREGHLEALVPCLPEVDPARADDVAAWVERLRQSLVERPGQEEPATVAGVSQVAAGSATYATALGEAAQAAEIALRVAGAASTLHFAHLGALRLIFHLAGNPELAAFQHDLLGPLEAYDRLHRSDLVLTLDGFFRAGGNHMRAARDLHVHRNTLIYRLERIRQLLGGTDLEDPDTRLNLQLALKIRDAFGTTQASGRLAESGAAQRPRRVG